MTSRVTTKKVATILSGSWVYWSSSWPSPINNFAYAPHYRLCPCANKISDAHERAVDLFLSIVYFLQMVCVLPRRFSKSYVQTVVSCLCTAFVFFSFILRLLYFILLYDVSVRVPLV